MTKFSLLYFCVGAAWVFAVGEGLGLVPAIWYGNEPDSTVVFGAVGGVMAAIICRLVCVEVPKPGTCSPYDEADDVRSDAAQLAALRLRRRSLDRCQRGMGRCRLGDMGRQQSCLHCRFRCPWRGHGRHIHYSCRLVCVEATKLTATGPGSGPRCWILAGTLMSAAGSRRR
jgi:hypothetical protein